MCCGGSLRFGCDWCLGLFGASLSVIGLWGGLALALWPLATRPQLWPFYVVFAAAVLACQLICAVFLQAAAARQFAGDAVAMGPARWADLLGFGFCSIIMLSVIVASSIGRTIVWRGVRYRINSRTEVELMAPGV